MMTPLLASEKTAAKMLDLPQSEFLRLVEVGALPGPVRVGPHERWRVDDLARIGTHEVVRGDVEI